MHQPVKLASDAAESGQVVLMMLFVITLVFLVGGIAVSLGLWVSERRGAQADADFAALKGAWALLDPSGTSADASSAANANFAANDEQGNADIENLTIDDSCFDLGEPDAVSIDVTHETSPLFGEIFNVVAPVPGAHAKACAGASLSPGPGDLVPFQIDDNTAPCFNPDESPNFTQLCDLDGGAQTANPRGIVDLDAPGDYCSDNNGSGAIQETIANGADGTCLMNSTDNCSPAKNGPWYECVAVQTGNPQKVLNGVQDRIDREGGCDTNGDGVESFVETTTIVFDSGDPLTSIYEAKDCDPSSPGKQVSVRLISIIILDEKPVPGNTGRPIKAFAGVYLVGCGRDPSSINLECHTTGPIGQQVVYGRLVNIINENGGVGPPSDSTTSFSIALVE